MWCWRGSLARRRPTRGADVQVLEAEQVGGCTARTSARSRGCAARPRRGPSVRVPLVTTSLIRTWSARSVSPPLVDVPPEAGSPAGGALRVPRAGSSPPFPSQRDSQRGACPAAGVVPFAVGRSYSRFSWVLTHFTARMQDSPPRSFVLAHTVSHMRPYSKQLTDAEAKRLNELESEIPEATRKHEFERAKRLQSSGGGGVSEPPAQVSRASLSAATRSTPRPGRRPSAPRWARRSAPSTPRARSGSRRARRRRRRRR